MCKEPCSNVIQDADVGHATHSGTFPNVRFVSTIDSLGETCPEFMLPYVNPIENTTMGQNINSVKTDNLKNNQEAYALLHNSHKSPRQRRDDCQSYMWENIQKYPRYNRSLSLIFTETVNFANSTLELKAFEKEFKTSLGDKIYNLDKRGDCRYITIAMLSACKKTIEPQILDKLRHIHFEGKIIFNKKLLEDLALMIKTHAFYT